MLIKYFHLHFENFFKCFTCKDLGIGDFENKGPTQGRSLGQVPNSCRSLIHGLYLAKTHDQSADGWRTKESHKCGMMNRENPICFRNAYFESITWHKTTLKKGKMLQKVKCFSKWTFHFSKCLTFCEGKNPLITCFPNTLENLC